MDMAYGKVIELFLVNGTADSIVTAELSNWNGKAIKIPRTELPSCKLEDITEAGVYFLFCKKDDGNDAVYIGESENVRERLMQHLQDYNTEKEKYYWNTAVIFIGRDLNKTLIRYLEDRLVNIAEECKRYALLTKKTYSKTVMKASQKATMEEFLDNVKVLINALGYKVLEPLVQHKVPGESIKNEVLEISVGSAKALGMVTPEGFVVMHGATLNEKISEKSLTAGIVKLRKNYAEDGRVKDLKTTEDLLFSSSSAAADFILGYSVSGPKTWKTKDGHTLKEIESSKADIQLS